MQAEAARCLAGSGLQRTTASTGRGECRVNPVVLQEQAPAVGTLASQFGQGSGAEWWLAEESRLEKVSAATCCPPGLAQAAMHACLLAGLCLPASFGVTRACWR